ncbi:MAG: DUF2075 domain-containing protein [Acidobacteria bacterium]|nr:DUF2075 domain-containing protein [Acidobacteriota bacterium]
MRYYYSNSLIGFFADSPEHILGTIQGNTPFDIRPTETDAWTAQIEILKNSISVQEGEEGEIFFEYAIPRMGRRVDVVIVTRRIILVIEFKVGKREFQTQDIDQVWDYALDLKNFHETSHLPMLAPILVATEAPDQKEQDAFTVDLDQLIKPITTNANQLGALLGNLFSFAVENNVDTENWADGSYSPTPTIIEAAVALYNQHSVSEITSKAASARNLRETNRKISEVIRNARLNSEKAICFVTGVPGAGKTLVGLDIATNHLDEVKGTKSVFLSGNGPLVAILREALARDSVRRKKEIGERKRLGDARREAAAFIQPVHHYRDTYLKDTSAPFDNIAIFDEAQRAWDLEQTRSFLKRKRGLANFDKSEPEFLISCLERHQDWAVIICLVGGGQEIHRGEAGISEWIDALNRSFPHWKIYISDRLNDSEYSAGHALDRIERKENLNVSESLHLSVSMRSYRAENVSKLVKNLLDIEPVDAREELEKLNKRFPVVLTRNVEDAKRWLREKARGSERFGMVVSSNAYRLKPHAIDVRVQTDPVKWFLEGKEDVRSSYFLEDVATEFQVQGLELDWACVTWDADFRYTNVGWDGYSFVGTKWQRVLKEERKQYLINAYRVLLTRARQGMVVVVPRGDKNDDTRLPAFYDSTYQYLSRIGFSRLESA